MTTQAFSKFSLKRLSLAAALACGSLTACGGGGDSQPATSQPAEASQADASAKSANSSQTGTDTATSMDTIYSTTQAVALASASTTAPSVTNTVVNCAGGGTATLTISGGTPTTQLNGLFDAGERYAVTYAQCTGASGHAQLSGSVEMDITSVASSPTSGTNAANIKATNLSLTVPSGNTVFNGSGTVSRSASTAADGSVTTISHVTVPNATLTNNYSLRDGSFTLSDLDATRTVKSVAGTVTGSQYTGHHSLSGSARGRSFSIKVSTNGSISYDAAGVLASGQWTLVTANATIVTTVANGTVVLTVDDSSNGSIDHTWTFPTATLNASAS
jgi:uncharacterized protein YaiE (UPF0345 family)